MNTLHYSISIQWEPKDQIFIARVPELKGCVAHGITYQEALDQIMDAMQGWIEDAVAAGEQLPEPNIYDVGDIHAHPLTEEMIQAAAEAARQANGIHRS